MEHQNNSFLLGEKVYLRAFEEGDETMIARIENHPDPRTTLFYALPTSVKQQLHKTEKQLSDPNSILFTICSKHNDVAIGQTAFFRIDWIGRMAVFYIGIADKENWSKGYGSETVALMLEYAFDTLNLNRVHLHVAAENKAAVAVYKKCGFIQEGTLREAMFRNGQYSDFYVMGCLKKDWKEVQTASLQNYTSDKRTQLN
ncbi:GNAT family N-acetyltransferase [Sediminitomix flava]|nr:GNAT family protein [Sediminitomix flava]